jgi:hypothetical protein
MSGAPGVLLAVAALFTEGRVLKTLFVILALVDRTLGPARGHAPRIARKINDICGALPGRIAILPGSLHITTTVGAETAAYSRCP